MNCYSNYKNNKREKNATFIKGGFRSGDLG